MSWPSTTRTTIETHEVRHLHSRSICQRAMSNNVTAGVKTSREWRQVILAGMSFLAILLHLITLVSSVCLGGNVVRAVQQNKLSSETIVFSSQTLIVKTCLTYYYAFVYIVFNILLYDEIYNQLVPHILQNWFLPSYF